MSEFSELLKRLRGKETLRVYAKKVGISNAYYSQLENGIVRNPSVDTLRKLIRAHPGNQLRILKSLDLVGFRSKK